ncbi:hypothetical protein LA080_009180 [Diaporthe eres]|nr:hypothetical protein LA080_009180 [Diaporthe eres]
MLLFQLPQIGTHLLFSIDAHNKFSSVPLILLSPGFHRQCHHHQNYYPHYSTRARRSSSTKTKGSLQSSSSGYPALADDKTDGAPWCFARPAIEPLLLLLF